MISAAEYIKSILDEKSGNNSDAKFFLMVPRGNKKRYLNQRSQFKTISIGNLLTNKGDRV